jgi:hypothetical protein
MLDDIQRLRDLGAVRITFHPDGKLASVDFGPAPDDTEPQAGTPDANVPRAFRELMKASGQ